MDRLRAADRVRAFARACGFELFGIAKLTAASTAPALRRWLERGDHGGMAWMEKHERVRSDPRHLLPGVQSALVVGLRYAPLAAVEESGGETSPFWNGVARYARGRDYHELLRERLGGVQALVEAEFPGTESRICVDTAPLLERELAARAGLGAIGKNTNLIHPEHGSWFLLGELLLKLDLAPDAPVADLCGSCRRCLDACPTGALPEPYRLDARRCLSYWTIEHRGEIPEPFRPHVAARTFGCDICQEVCPWNDRVEPASEPELEVPAHRRALGLIDLLQMDADRYAEIFRSSAMKRSKLEGLRRNAALAAAGDPAAATSPLLAEIAAGDPSPTVRDAAAWALSRRKSAD